MKTITTIAKHFLLLSLMIIGVLSVANLFTEEDVLEVGLFFFMVFKILSVAILLGIVWFAPYCVEKRWFPDFFMDRADWHLSENVDDEMETEED